MQVISSVAQKIVIKDASGTLKDSWNAEVGVPHPLTLPSGTYVVVYMNSDGQSEKIALML